MSHSSCIKKGTLFIVNIKEIYDSPITFGDSHFIGKINNILNNRYIYYDIIYQLEGNDSSFYELGSNGYHMEINHFNKIARIITKEEAFLEMI